MKSSKMKTNKLFLIAILLFSINSYSQNKNLVAAWYWADSTNTRSISIFFRNKKDITQMLDLVKNPVITDSTNKNGKYSIKNDSILVITWNDGATEVRKFKFLNNYEDTLQMTIAKNDEPGLNGIYIFHKVVDEEVKP